MAVKGIMFEKGWGVGVGGMFDGSGLGGGGGCLRSRGWVRAVGVGEGGGAVSISY